MVQVNDDRSSNVEWSHPAEGWYRRLHFGFIVSTWLIALVLAVLLTAIVSALVIFIDGADGTITTEAAHLVAAVATFIVFVSVTRARLRGLDHDRWSHGIMVGLLHTMVAVVLIVATAVIAKTTQITDSLSGGRSEEIGLIAVAFERSAAAAVLAGILAAATMPATGATPKGTQREATTTEHQL